MRVVRLLTASMCYLLTALLAPVSADEPKALTAQDLLDRMAKTYGDCKSYGDSGVVKTVFVMAGGNMTVEQPFRTAFVRPDRFRFEFSNKDLDGKVSRFIVWRKGKDVQTWWDIDGGAKKAESLSQAVAGAAGVSFGAAHSIPRLLLPKEIGGRSLVDLADAKRLKDVALGKAECYRVEGKFADSTMTLWIDKKTFLVRKIEQQTKLPDFRTERTTTYEPFLDEAVPDKALEFDPPKGK